MDSQIAFECLGIKTTGTIKRFRAIRFCQVEETKNILIMLIAHQDNFVQFASHPAFMASDTRPESGDAARFYFKVDKDQAKAVKHFTLISESIFNNGEDKKEKPKSRAKPKKSDIEVTAEVIEESTSTKDETVIEA